ncbi:MAG TPA: FliM/FliN family flagellar motor switch protein [Methylovirgula sp.]|nr:FliM/FliN family flagellar motor switch protein [Methylovirgula sp.]
MARNSSQSEVRSTGPERLLDSASISVERMPMLHVIFDRMATQSAENARQLSTAPAYFSVNSIKTERIGGILESYEGKAVVAVFQAQKWDARIMLGLDNKLVFTLVEALFGGDGSEAAYMENRALTSIEMRVAQKTFDMLARTLQVCFSVIEETRFKFERIESRMDFAVIAPRNNFAVITRLNLRILGRSGEVFVVIPQTALNPIRQSLSRDLSNEVLVPDPRWSKQIHTEIGRSEVTVSAIIEEDNLTLGDIAEFKVGQVFELSATPRSRVKLECNGTPLYWCQLGQAEGHYTLKVDELVDSDQEFFNGLVQR